MGVAYRIFQMTLSLAEIARLVAPFDTQAGPFNSISQGINV